MAAGRADAVVLALFFLSGASALIYEVVWGRRLGFIFGGTAFAISTVLAAYMAGLALGSWIFGRRIDRKGHPLVVYAVLEAGIAAWALILPLLFHLLNGLYGAIHGALNPGPSALTLLRFALTFLVLLVPTILMGGTLPVLSKLLVGDSPLTGRKAGLLYGFNTIGAVAGVLAAGFVLMPALGMTGATIVAVIFNLAVAAAAWLIRGRVPYVERSVPVPAGAADAAAGTPPSDGSVGTPKPRAARRAAAGPSGVPTAALWVYAASGFAALTYEVAWTKVLAGALGTTTYALSAMLGTFLLGLALGALWMSRLAVRRDPVRLLAFCQLAIAALALAALPLFDRLPLLYVEAWRLWGPSWGAQTLARFVLCMVTMLPPAILLGGVFPLVVRIYADQAGRVGSRIGQLYAANTVGAIAGSVMAGFVLIPLLGRQGTLLAAAAVNVLAGAGLYALVWRTTTGGARLAAIAMAGLIVPLALLGARPWDRHLQISGAYVYAKDYSRLPAKELAAALHQDRILHYKEETDAVVAVTQRDQVLSVRINGKADAGTGDDMLTQRLLGHLPLLHRPAAEDVLVIGLASGVTLGSVLAHPQVRRADCVEMLATMDQVVPFFRDVNHDCLADPRAHLLVGDGRNHLAMTRTSYDVIISEPSNPWISGIGSLFTREFFALGTRRLKPGGLFCQWVQTYQMSRGDFGAVLRTFHEAFPHTALWMAWPGDVLLLGSHEPIRFDQGRVAAMLQHAGLRRDLEPLGITTPEALLQSYIGGAGVMERLAGPDARLITDDNLLLEFSMPRHLYDSGADMMSIGVLAAAREAPGDYVDRSGARADSTDMSAARQEDRMSGRNRALAGIEAFWAGDPAAAQPALEEAYRLAPEDPLARLFLGRALNRRAVEAAQSGRDEAALADLRRAVQLGIGAERERSRAALSQLLARDAVAPAPGGMSAPPEGNPEAGMNAGLAFERTGRLDLAEKEYRETLRQWPEHAGTLACLATLLSRNAATLPEAQELGQKAVRLDPSPTTAERYGWILAVAGRLDEAEPLLRQAADAMPERPEIRMRLASVLVRSGKKDAARAELERIIRDDPSGKVGQMARQALGTL